MNSEQCSLGSILPPNYRHRAEAFARDLQQRLWSLGSSRSSASEDRLGKRHPTFEPKCPPPFADFEDSSPRSPTEDPTEVADSLGQSLVNRSDGLPIPYSACADTIDSARCSFSSDSQQSIYSTPSENFGLATCAKLARNEFPSNEQTDAPVASCDLFLDLYNSIPFVDSPSQQEVSEDYNVAYLNHNESSSFKVETPCQREVVSHLPNVKQSTCGPAVPVTEFERVNGVTESRCSRIEEESENDSLESLANSLSQITLNGDVSNGTCTCESSLVSRLENSESEINELSSRDACVDRNANEVNKRVPESESLDSSGILSSDSLNSYSSDSLNASDSLNSSDSLITSDYDRTIVNGETEDTFLEESPEPEDQWSREKNKTDTPVEHQNGETETSGCERQRLRRCSSLKTWKTPPDTPGRKKIVRFADVLGLDLADIRTFMDEIPQVPKSAFSDLQGMDSDLYNFNSSSSLGSASVSVPTPKFLVPLFQQPGGMVDFFDKLNIRKVCLENATVTDPALLAIAGTVRVRNVDYDKSVFIRYTTDGWKSYADLKALYVVNSCDGHSDQFSFILYAHTLEIGDRLEFAVFFQTKSEQYWDNNGGINYIFQCVPSPPMVNAAMPGVGSPSISDKYGGFY